MNIKICLNLLYKPTYMKRIALLSLALFFSALSNAQIDKESDTLIRLNGVEIRGVQDKPLPYQVEIIQKSAVESRPAKDIGLLLRDMPNVSGIR